ncbi:thioredoxin family protein [Sulfurospirillum oryzae]|uniref:thioredoxin family protein n=1 Tax=Sulfurospirillum oryzae TaxID=2976535 RepID=UPI0021E7F9D1|nr:thioredoxin family protein [Sulfurospirillum oryzae]
MKKKIVLAVLALFLAGFCEAKEPNAFSWKQSNEVSSILDATAYAQIVPQIRKSPMLIEFGSTSCASCVEMGKLLYRVKQEYPQSAIYFVEVHSDQQATRDYRIQMIPTQIYLDAKGGESYRHIGIVSYEQLIANLKAEKIIF